MIGMIIHEESWLSNPKASHFGKTFTFIALFSFFFWLLCPCMNLAMFYPFYRKFITTPSNIWELFFFRNCNIWELFLRVNIINSYLMVVHVHRQHNGCADLLAKKSIISPIDWSLFQSCPGFLYNNICADNN